MCRCKAVLGLHETDETSECRKRKLAPKNLSHKPAGQAETKNTSQELHSYSCEVGHHAQLAHVATRLLSVEIKAFRFSLKI